MISSANLSQNYWSKANKWFINTYKNSWLEEVIHAPVKLRENIAVTTAGLVEAKTLLDLGCGPSRVLAKALIEAKVQSAVGMDFSEFMLEESSKYLSQLNLTNRVILRNVDLLEINDYPETDICFALGLFDYIKEAKLIVSKAHISSKYLVCSWPAKNPRNFLRRFRYSCPIYTYDKEDILKLFDSIGVRNVRLIPAGGYSGYITISYN
ncbi:class I SAM-dependent methyltransferase [Prochlorococcus sp. MIT 1223]|uniref:class I SAM-dependent methyltransferase n=1 Tax=Prochlorococcus sp. MIT 1223 TaxID=3096217 RepID=UPI002A75D1D2|nr:class I SAM-dependent methyltransferase [Prochlorococcus sp. MIT 1223]